jgi:hypothetical protein
MVIATIKDWNPKQTFTIIKFPDKIIKRGITYKNIYKYKGNNHVVPENKKIVKNLNFVKRKGKSVININYIKKIK